jgi:hypothetical protein
MKKRPTSKNINFPLPLPSPWGILLAFFPKLVRVNRRIGRRSGITKLLCDATTRGSSPSSVPQKKIIPAISIPKKIGIQISNFSSGTPA